MSKIFIYLIISCCILLKSISGLGPFESTVPHKVQPRLKSSSHIYTPTNSWFENLLLGKGESAIQTYPYQVKASHDGFCISYSGKSINQKAFILEGFLKNIVLSIQENMPDSLIDQSTVNADFYDLSAKINYGSQFDITLVRGSASVVANYRGVTPIIKTIHAIMNNPSGSTRSLKLQFNNGQTWLVQSEKAITWQTAGSEVKANSQYTGWLKISIVTSSMAENALNSYLDSPLITNGHVSYQVDRSSNQVNVYLEYNANGLYYILPHAYKSNLKGAKLIDGAMVKGIKGSYKMASGMGYRYSAPLIPNSDRYRAFDTEEKRIRLKAALQDDLASLKFNVKDPYFGGKELARAAKLIEIADGINEFEIRDKIKDKLTEELDNFWFGISTNTPALVYEPTWGGIVSRASVGNPQADFGQSYYNDHHFHYGYHINAAATLAKYYPSYYESRKEYYKIIIADYAGTCEYKELPCQARAKDPFLGHSYAAGIFEFADSRNQESTSESINGYFAVRELGKNSNDRYLEDLGDFLLSTEVLSSQMYWQIKDTEIYDTPFANNGVVGILWETKVDYATFFGANPEYIYGIQMLPYNDITQAYLDPLWLKKSKPVWNAVTSQAVDAWKCFLLLADALINPDQSGLSEKIHNLATYDNGNSKTNTLYFYYMVGGNPSGVKPQFTKPVTTTSRPDDSSPTPQSQTTTHSDLSTGDVGRPDPNCPTGYLMCFTLDDEMKGCYNPAEFTCFIGGNLCSKPYKACLNLNKPAPGAACYDTALYTCSNDGILKPLH